MYAVVLVTRLLPVRLFKLALPLLAGVGLLMPAAGQIGASPPAAEDESVIIGFDLPAAAASRHPRDSVRRTSIRARQQQIVDALAGEGVVLSAYEGIPAMAVRVPGATLQRLRGSGIVKSISPNRTVYPATSETALLINADQPRDVWGVTGEGVVVAVLDTGIDTDHPDLADDILYERCFDSEEGHECDGEAEASGPGAAEDEVGHGTNVSGIITGNGTVAPEGIAPGAKIAVYKVLADGNGTYDDILNGLDDILVSHPEVDLINMSITDGSFNSSACDSFIPAFGTAIDSLRAAGVLTFAASGNNGYTGGISWPACISNVVATGAVWDETLPTIWYAGCEQTPAPVDTVACFSNSGVHLDLLAPGAFLTSTYLGGGAATYGGTSQASPVAAAVAAMLLQADPALTPAAIESFLESTGDPTTDGRNGLVRPRVDAAAAVLAAADSDGDGLPTPFDNCSSTANPGQENTDKKAIPNGPQLAGDDLTWPMSDALGDICDPDDDNDGLSDADEATGAACSGFITDPLLVDHDGDHLTDGWECAHYSAQPESIPTDSTKKYLGSGTADTDGDRIPDLWEQRGYNGSGSSTDSDGDGCADLVEAVSVDGNRALTDADRIAIARRVLGVWAPDPEQDYAFDIDKSGAMGDADRIFVARAVLLPAWLPKTCP